MFTEEEIEQIKNYCQIDYDDDDDFLIGMIEAAAIDIASAVDASVTISAYKNDPRFFLAVEKQSKANYDYRGESSETMQFPLIETVNNIVHQLRNGGLYNANDATK